THISQASGSGADEETGSIPRFPDVPSDESEEELSWNSIDEEGDDNEGKDGDGDEEDEGDDGEEGDDDDDDKDDDGEEGDDDDDDQEVERDDEKDDEEEGNGKEDLGLNVGREEGHDEEEAEDELYKDVNINQGRGMESIFKTTSQMDAQTPTSVAPLPMTAPTMTPSTIATITTTSQAPILPTTTPSTIIQDLPNFGSLFGFDNRLRTLEANFSEFMQTNQFAGAVFAILGIVQRYMDQRMNEAVKVAVQIQSGHLHDEAQRENNEFLKTVDENIQKIIKEQVKKQVKVQVSKILPRIEQTVNEQLENEKMEGNKSIQRSDEQMNLYKTLVKAYESDKIILDTYGETVTLKRRRDDDADKDEEPSAGPDRGSKRRKEGKEPESASAPKEKAIRSSGKSTQGTKSRQASASESAIAEEPIQTTFQMEEPSHPEFDTDRDWNKTVPATHESIQPWISELAKLSDSRSSFNKLMDTPLDFSNFLINRLKVDTLTPEFLTGPTYELMKGSCKSLVELEYHLKEAYKATTDQLDWVNPKGQQYPHNLLKPLPLIPNNRGHHVIPFEHFINNDLEYLHGEDLVPRTMWIEEPICYDKHALWRVSHWGRKRQQFYDFAVNRESARDVYSKRRIIAVTELKIVRTWIDNGNLTNLTVEECFAFNVFLRMFTRSIVIQRRMEDLQLGFESYQKKLNLTKLDSYRSDLKRKEAYTAYANPRGFIYQNKDKKNRLMWIDELHKFSDGTLTDVRTALDDRLKGIRMQYLP
nr:hypothetical protein [Tanacetum cinerariifolium]